MTDRPNAKELLEIARMTLVSHVLPLLPGEQRFSALMVASALGMAARELAAPPLPLPPVKTADIRAGKHDRDVALYEALLADGRARAAISNPKYLETG